jgi:hypothetical protein
MKTITAKTIAAFWAQCTEGTRMTCLDNTYNQRAPGTTGIITKSGKASMRLEQEDGRIFWINPPQRVRDIVSLTDDTITYYLGRMDEIGNLHTATWKIEADQ